jgi:hypothetical protein
MKFRKTIAQITTASGMACVSQLQTNRVKTLPRLLPLALLLSVAALGQQGVSPQIGLPVNFGTLTLHVQGQPITVYEFTVSLIPMNAPPPWPVGQWLYTYVQADAGSGTNKSTWGPGSWCRWWIYEVASLEQQHAQQTPYPYFEINLPLGVELMQTDEGIQVYPAGSVTCWQASDDYAPV